MTSDVRQTLVGGLVVIAFALVLIFSYGGPDLKSGGGYYLTANFNRVDGLVEGDEVRLGGIKVGTVIKRFLDENYRAILRFEIDSGIELPIDTSVAIHTDGLLGTKFAVLEPGGEEEYLQPGDEIAFTQDALIVEELLELIISEGRARQAKQRQGGN
jgi:phospholipid/cholesterol/gamma-HCH transport system substrate-binding protein